MVLACTLVANAGDTNNKNSLSPQMSIGFVFLFFHWKSQIMSTVVCLCGDMQEICNCNFFSRFLGGSASDNPAALLLQWQWQRVSLCCFSSVFIINWPGLLQWLAMSSCMIVYHPTPLSVMVCYLFVAKNGRKIVVSSQRFICLAAI